jgi:hypothetical protein
MENETEKTKIKTIGIGGIFWLCMLVFLIFLSFIIIRT